MVTRMRITVEVADVLVAEATRVAAEGATTLDELVEHALCRELIKRRECKLFKLRDGSVGGRGLKPEFASADWTSIIAASYERGET
jgi:Bacterial antitoxin of type II TA system, VapB